MSSKEAARNPLPMAWPYSHDDETTWPYLDCIIGGKNGDQFVSKWIRNPYFRYGHLLRNW